MGYIYWIVAAHLFSTQVVGASAALISILGLIATIAPFGLDSSLVYILARSKKGWAKIVYSFFLVIFAATVLLAGLSIPLVDSLNKTTGSVRLGASFEDGVIFVLICLAWTFSLVIDELFTVEEITILVLVRNCATSVLKLLFLPLALLFSFNKAPLIILAGWGLGSFLASLLTLGLFWRQKHQEISLKPQLDFGLVRKHMGLSLGNYGLTVTQQIPFLVLPVIVTQAFSAQLNAYFYTVYMFVQGVLLTIPLAISQVFFAQTGETSPDRLRAKMNSLLGITSLVMLPFIAGSILLRDQVLGLFGSEYIANGSGLLVVMSLGALPASFIRLYVSLQRIRGNFGRGLVATVGGVITIVLGTLGCVPLFGLLGVGLGWTLGLTALAIGLGFDLSFSWRKQTDDFKILQQKKIGTEIESNDSIGVEEYPISRY